MALFPKIQSPCPYQANLAAIMDGSICRMCKREVVDLTAMDDAGRIAFFGDCKTEVCVSYSVPVRSMLGAAALAAAAVAALPAAAQDVASLDVAVIDTGPGIVVTGTDLPDYDDVVVLAGGIKKPGEVEMVETDPEDANVPEISVVYETPEPAKKD
ncbi:MAG: hypothetical protein ACAH11_12875 [Sphingomonas sp.]